MLMDHGKKSGLEKFEIPTKVIQDNPMFCINNEILHPYFFSHPYF